MRCRAHRPVLAPMMVLGMAIVAHGQTTPRLDNCSATGKYFNATSNKMIDCASKAVCYCDKNVVPPESVIKLPAGAKTHHKVGVLPIRGPADAFKEFNETFATYLTCEMKCRYSPPVTFEMVPITFESIFSSVLSKAVDFLYVNPSAYSCIESEFGASSLVSQIGFQKIGPNRFEIQEFGGIIFAMANRNDINSVKDVKDKSYAAASISGLGSGLAQFQVFVKKGMSYINDPSQVVFTNNQGTVVTLVEQGKVDVGFVRTNQLELMGKNLSKFKILEKYVASSGGEPYPFDISTELYPEWNVAALAHVDWRVAQGTQEALLRLKFPHPAAVAGNFKGWRPTLSYALLRNMQEEVGYIFKNPETGAMQCVREGSLWESITCPAGHFKLARDIVEGACAAAGKPCPAGFQCVCKPCKRAAEVEVQMMLPSAAAITARRTNPGCRKMSVCGDTTQTETINFMVTDNKQRAKFNLTYGVRDATTADAALNLVEGYRLKAAHTWGINVTVKTKGLALLQIYVNGEEIVDSPLFIKIDTGKCADELRVPDELGVCKCNPSTTSVNGRCVRLSLLIPVIVVPAVVLIAAGVLAYLQYLLSKRDAVWTVKRAELLLDDPAEVLGRGTFGMVVKAEYRGTSVAVKRVIPPRKGTSRESIFDVQTSLKGNSFKASIAGSHQSGEGKMEEEEGEVGPDELALHVQDARAGMAGPSSAGLASHGGTFSISSRSQTSEPWWKTLWYGDELSRLRADFVEEMRMLSKLRHPCITTVMGAVIDKNTEPMMVMEMMEYGSLYDLLHNDSIEIDGDLVLPILRDIAQGLRFLHAAEPLIVHGDLKSHNVLVDAKFRAKVADFGLSQKKALGISTQLGMSRAAPSGTPYWMAPELLNGHHNTTASDVYAFAVVLFEVYSRQEPYLGEQTDEVLKEVANVERREPKRPGIPRSCPEGAAQLMQDCWHTQPELRPPFDEIERRLKALTSASANPLSQISAQGCGPARRAAMTKTEDMLYDVFPRHIADALKQGRTVEPERKECVTIFFSDIVGFTVISGTLDPEKVSMMLHRLYTAFDALSREFAVFKVETIGDAYMAVTNLVQDQEDDHAVRIAQFAIGAIKAAQATPIDLDDPSKGCVRIRVGFHSGPVVANVVGTRNLRYCLFGDTVNTASRMESNSEELKIHVSQRAAEILRKQLGALAPAARRRIRVKARGVIQVKGKGEMKTYWVSESSGSSNSIPFNSSGSFNRQQLNTVSEDVNSEERQTTTEVDAGMGPVETLYTVSEVDAAADNSEIPGLVQDKSAGLVQGTVVSVASLELGTDVGMA